jgi:hypothetical protein
MVNDGVVKRVLKGNVGEGGSTRIYEHSDGVDVLLVSCTRQHASTDQKVVLESEHRRALLLVTAQKQSSLTCFTVQLVGGWRERTKIWPASAIAKRYNFSKFLAGLLSRE